MRHAHAVNAALLLGVASTPLTLEPLRAQNISNAREDPGRWAWPGYGAPEILPVSRRAIIRRLRTADDPDELICIDRFRTGSLNFDRVCGTRQEWVELVKKTR